MESGTKTIELSRGMVALVDAADFDWLSQWSWCAVPASDGGTFYAQRSGNRRMHNAIMLPQRGQLVDHINRNGLDNRRSNLRLCSFRQNMANRSFKPGVSGYRGVYRYRDRWSANISFNGRSKVIATFDNPTDAARAFDAAARQHYGEFAVLNFPNGESQ